MEDAPKLGSLVVVAALRGEFDAFLAAHGQPPTTILVSRELLNAYDDWCSATGRPMDAAFEGARLVVDDVLVGVNTHAARVHMDMSPKVGTTLKVPAGALAYVQRTYGGRLYALCLMDGATVDRIVSDAGDLRGYVQRRPDGTRVFFTLDEILS